MSKYSYQQASKNSTKNMAKRDMARVCYTVNVWGMEYLINNPTKNKENCTEETCKLGYQKMTER